MSWFKRNPFGPIRIPSGSVGDAAIDLMCRLSGTTREEALKRGRESMQTVTRMGPVIPRPMKAPVGACLFDLDKKVDIEEAKRKSELTYTANCLRMAQTILGMEDPDVAKTISIRHYYSTRHVLKMVEAWFDLILKKNPDLNDEHAEDIKWAIRRVIEDADSDYAALSKE
jgi:hypothetical protein